MGEKKDFWYVLPDNESSKVKVSGQESDRDESKDYCMQCIFSFT